MLLGVGLLLGVLLGVLDGVGVLLGVLDGVFEGLLLGVGDAQVADDLAITSGASSSFIVITVSLPVPEYLEIYKVEAEDPAAV